MVVNMELATLPVIEIREIGLLYLAEMLTSGEEQPAAARPAHGDTAEHDPPPAYIPNHEPLPPTYQAASQQLKDSPPRKGWFRSRLFLAVVMTLVTAAIIASLAAVFTIQAKNRVRKSPKSRANARRQMITFRHIEARVFVHLHAVRATCRDRLQSQGLLRAFCGSGTSTKTSQQDTVCATTNKIWLDSRQFSMHTALQSRRDRLVMVPHAQAPVL